jgi:hypothetical protein
MTPTPPPKGECEACPPKKPGSFPLTREGVIEKFCEPHHALLASVTRERDGQVSETKHWWDEALRLQKVADIHKTRAETAEALVGRGLALADDVAAEPGIYLSQMGHPIDKGYAEACASFAKRLREALLEAHRGKP